MLPGMEILACPNLAVSPDVMKHIVRVESSANPYAIGIVGGRLQRQPKDLAEALATVKMLDTKGYNFSVGLAQVNRTNLGRYGLDSYPKAFNACSNLSAGAHILADCYAGAHGDWGKAFSCYYSGNFTTGFRDGYVQKIYASIEHDLGTMGKATTIHPSVAIAVRSQPAKPRMSDAPARMTDLEPVIVHAHDSASYRVALRSMAIDVAATATVPANVAAVGQITNAQATAAPASPLTEPGDRSANHVASTAADQPLPLHGREAAAADQAVASGDNRNDSVFVPEIRGPDDPNDASTPTDSGTPREGLSAPYARAGGAHLGPEQRDAAFVF